MKKLFLMFAVAGLMASCAGNGTTSGSASTSASGETKDGETTENMDLSGFVLNDNIKWPAIYYKYNGGSYIEPENR